MCNRCQRLISDHQMVQLADSFQDLKIVHQLPAYKSLWVASQPAIAVVTQPVYSGLTLLISDVLKASFQDSRACSCQLILDLRC